jgi:SAM-dependent methyltransferase
MRVTGVDRSTFLLDKARQRARDAGVEIEWVQSDMRDFVRPAVFGLALNLFTSFGYFDDKNDDARVLRNIHDSLQPGGSLVMEITSKEWLAEGFHPTTSEELEDGTLLVERHEIFDDWTRIRNEWILIRGERARRFHFHHTLYSGQELKDRLLAAGFSAVNLFGDIDGSAYGLHTKRLIALATK